MTLRKYIRALLEYEDTKRITRPIIHEPDNVKPNSAKETMVGDGEFYDDHLENTSPEDIFGPVPPKDENSPRVIQDPFVEDY